MRIILYNPQREDERSIAKLADVYRCDLTIARTPDDVLRLAEGIDHLVALEHTRDATPLGKFHPRFGSGLAVVTGSMNAGLPREVLDLCEETVVVEQYDDTGFMAPVHAMSIFVHHLFQLGPNSKGAFG